MLTPSSHDPFIRRDAVYKLAEQGVKIGMVFDNEDPPGWYVGTILTTPIPKGKGQDQKFWVNFTEAGEMDSNDDVLIIASSLVSSTYNMEWVMLCREGTKDQFVLAN
jgi:hypothetical protein